MKGVNLYGAARPEGGSRWPHWCRQAPTLINLLMRFYELWE